MSKADLPKSMPSQMGSWGLSCRRGRKNRGGNGVRMPRENPLLQFTVSEPWLIDLCWSMRRVDALFIIVWRPNLFRHVVVWWQSSTLSTFKRKRQHRVHGQPYSEASQHASARIVIWTFAAEVADSFGEASSLTRYSWTCSSHTNALKESEISFSRAHYIDCHERRGTQRQRSQEARA